jgi:phage FluMu protein Com
MKKISFFSLHDPYIIKIVNTPGGQVCVEIELECIRCKKRELIAIPEELRNQIGNESNSERGIVNHIATERGWSICNLVRNGNYFDYNVCLECVNKDYEEYFSSIKD